MPLITIVTRTQNRIILLNRLKANLLLQDFQDFIWIIVNDGGSNISVIDQIVIEAKKAGINTKVIHNPISLGRSCAANIGIKASNTKYVMLLDDDDTLSRDCLKIELDFLEKHANTFKGVSCQVATIFEQVDDDNVQFINKGTIFVNDTHAFNISKAFAVNPIMTCGFLYCRDIWEKIGGYPENINYTEDWYFNVQFLLIANIAIIPKVLAYAHYRTDQIGFYSNTTSNFEKINEHKLTAIAWQNNLIRQLADKNNIMAAVLSNAIMYNDISLLNSQRDHSFLFIEKCRNILKKIYNKSGIKRLFLLIRNQKAF